MQPRPKLENWSADLDRFPTTNAVKPAREQLTLIRMSCAGSLTRVAMMRYYARKWQRERLAMTADAYAPLSFFATGEAHQFDGAIDRRAQSLPSG